MKVKANLKELLEEDLIGKIYNNNLYLSEYMPENKEYIKLSKSNAQLSKIIMQNSDENLKDLFLQYVEQNSQKEGIDAEEQFKLGFKTAVKLIMEGLR